MNPVQQYKMLQCVDQKLQLWDRIINKLFHLLEGMLPPKDNILSSSPLLDILKKSISYKRNGFHRHNKHT
jgi:hypothetical protein